MIICTLINVFKVKRVAMLDVKVPPYHLIANGKLFVVDPASWSTTEERLANLTPTYNEIWCPDVSNILETPPEKAEAA